MPRPKKKEEKPIPTMDVFDEDFEIRDIDIDYPRIMQMQVGHVLRALNRMDEQASFAIQAFRSALKPYFDEIFNAEETKIEDELKDKLAVVDNELSGLTGSPVRNTYMIAQKENEKRMIIAKSLLKKFEALMELMHRRGLLLQASVTETI